MSDWTQQRIEQMAPDAASMKAAQGLAKPSNWLNLGHNEQLLWGECKGSGANPYQVRCDLSDASYKCSCPSRKLPCKHSLGLLLLYASNNVAQSQAPAFVTEWHEARSKRAEAKATKANAPPEPVDEAAQQKRAAKREGRVESGLELLESSLADIVTQGLAAARSFPQSYWTQLASRLVDSQAAGLARRVTLLGDLFMIKDEWQNRALAEMSRLQLLIDAYRNQSQLPPMLMAEIRNLIGFTQDQKELLVRQGVRDRWLVGGKEHIEENTMRIQRTWLYGLQSQQAALLLDFAVGKQPLPATYTIGQVIEAELVYFDGAPPLRALVKDRIHSAEVAKQLPLGISVLAVQKEFARCLALNPWLERWPVIVGPVIPVWQDSVVRLIDTEQRVIGLHPSSLHKPHLLTLSGGLPLTIFGLWDGQSLLPLAVADQRNLFAAIAQESIGILSKVA